MGFRAKDNAIQTYTQRKTGFSYFYVKREVCDNGIDTKPLSLTLTPWKNYNAVFVGHKSVLSNDFATQLTLDGETFFSAHHCFVYTTAKFHQQMDKAAEVLNCPNWFLLKRIKIQFKPTAEWYEFACTFMERLLQEKLVQCPEFADELRKHVGKSIYVAGFDRYWSCGFSERIAVVTDPARYPGANMLGKLLCKLTD